MANVKAALVAVPVTTLSTFRWTSMRNHDPNDKNHFEFEIWAPRVKVLEIVDETAEQSVTSLSRGKGGVHHGSVESISLPFRYSLRLDGDRVRPDPRSNYQPEGVHGCSQLSASTIAWTDAEWQGVPTEDLILYELHVGAFSKQGTFAGIEAELDYLLQLGVNAIELMPIAQCPGQWNWGYDGVGLFGVNSNYGTPEQFKMMVDHCHARGISVILDVVYNHVGPEGNYLGELGPYFSKTHGTPWGDAFNFDGPRNQHARQFVIDNALYWLREYHLDGLRLDAVHYMHDHSNYHIVQEICDRVREYETQVERTIHLIGEANIYDHDLIVSRGQRSTYSAIWADDLMHAIYSIAKADVQLTPRTYAGASDVAEALAHGYLYQGPVMKRVDDNDRMCTHGERYQFDRQYLSRLITALQTHDAVGNHPQGLRLPQLASHDFHRAAIALMMLYPTIPMIFMGEEFASESPFMFFSDFINPALRRAVDKGRKQEYPHHDWSQSIPPSDPRAFEHSKIELPKAGNSMLKWYQSLIQLRKNWKKMGWLQPKYFDVECRPEQQLFSISYRTPEQDVQVVAHLVDPGVDAQPRRFDGSEFSILLRSGESEESSTEWDGHLTLRPNEAVVGTGRLQWR